MDDDIPKLGGITPKYQPAGCVEHCWGQWYLACHGGKWCKIVGKLGDLKRNLPENEPSAGWNEKWGVKASREMGEWSNMTGVDRKTNGTSGKKMRHFVAVEDESTVGIWAVNHVHWETSNLQTTRWFWPTAKPLFPPTISQKTFSKKSRNQNDSYCNQWIDWFSDYSQAPNSPNIPTERCAISFGHRFLHRLQEEVLFHLICAATTGVVGTDDGNVEFNHHKWVFLWDMNGILVGISWEILIIWINHCILWQFDCLLWEIDHWVRWFTSYVIAYFHVRKVLNGQRGYW